MIQTDMGNSYQYLIWTIVYEWIIGSKKSPDTRQNNSIPRIMTTQNATTVREFHKLNVFRETTIQI